MNGPFSRVLMRQVMSRSEIKSKIRDSIDPGLFLMTAQPVTIKIDLILNLTHFELWSFVYRPDITIPVEWA